MKIKFILLILLITGSLATIAVLSSKETSFQLLDASQLAANPDKYLGENLRVRGIVKPGSLSRKGKQADFLLELNNQTVPVHFNGAKILPDTFEEGARARVDGRLKDGVLVSDHIETKCASKYEADYSDKNGQTERKDSQKNNIK